MKRCNIDFKAWPRYFDIEWYKVFHQTSFELGTLMADNETLPVISQFSCKTLHQGESNDGATSGVTF